jgi:hypothetical protein
MLVTPGNDPPKLKRIFFMLGLAISLYIQVFCYITKAQAKQRKSENEEKQRLIGLTPV